MVILDHRRRTRSAPAARYRHALVPLTEGPESELAVDLACRFVSDRHATVVALAAIEIELEQPLDVPAHEEEARAHKLLERAVAIGASYGVHVVPRTLRTRSAADAVLEEVARSGTEIIVLGLPRLDNGRHLGRTNEFVLRHAPCRVMLASFPPPGR